ncbi:hypothetical protein CERSUDRAFT_112798 [Gelatoporia subvermispora B]|uniref:Zn(2)-C6 fungal-type domain-containing protein n=1 Tax=Ceriporiopsis subvermispora (strain B) TaxID=914234 RepID=M2PR91_CERS8|nr:hypothetical protein CERSUDRAFT_112798 [Gelatoporia subvermispora B]
MPVDHSRPNAATRQRRSGRKDIEEDKFDSSHSREIELKRSRGEISCAECRRLKIRCDKSIPCQSCQRRGCAALCPNGSLATGQGTRFVLAATEHLHKRIAKMSERIRQLEDALAVMQAKCSNDPHPLLSGEEATVPGGPDEDIPPPEQTSPAKADVLDAFGTLTVSDHGVSRFFGPTGGPEYLLLGDGDTTATSPSVGDGSPHSMRDSRSPSVPEEVMRFSTAFPLTPMGSPEAVKELITSHLPSYDRALHLSGSYFKYAGWLFRGVSEQQLLDEMLPYFYKKATISGGIVLEDEYGGPHSLALVMLILANGALVDPELEPYNAEAEHYVHLGRAALSLESVFEQPSLITIQALHLMSIYHSMTGGEPGKNDTSMETSWGLLALTAQLSQTVGLHRDSARWGLPDRIVNRRRVSFWDLFVADSWQSLATGRSPSISRKYIDCEYPHKDDDDNEGEPGLDYESWSFRFAFECVSMIVEKTLTAEAPSYTTIMDLDRKVREFPISPEALAMVEELEAPPDAEPPSLEVAMQSSVMSHSREVMLLYIHRSFFVQAIINCPENPLRSPYAPSFLAAYRASSIILKMIREQFAANPDVATRFWANWTFSFSAAVVFATVVTRGPRSQLAPNAMAQLEVATDLFAKAAKTNRRAAKALPILVKLTEKAHHAIAGTTQSIGAMTDGTLWKVKTEDDADEETLQIFAGKTKLVAVKAPSRSPSAVSTQSQPSPQQQEPPKFAQQAPPMLQQHGPPTSSLQEPVRRLEADWQPTQTPQAYASSYPSHSVQQQSVRQHYRPVVYDQQAPPPVAPTQDYGWSQQHASMPMQMPPQQPPQHYNAPRYQPPLPPQPGPSVYRDDGPVYHAATPFQGVQQAYVPPAELVNLGLASRDSRLDERWASFMQESGFLDGINFRA